jgi:tRNA pseudouridine38-40 synthase
MRYFLEVAYDGFSLSGFQIQKNAPTVQSEIVKAFAVLFRKEIAFTGSSRTDAKVHAYQNFFHFDIEEPVDQKIIYNLNAILPPAIVVKKIFPVLPDAHARFSAVSREYEYVLISGKNPFLYNRAFYYPYRYSFEKLESAAALILEQTNFERFCKANAQVSNYQCRIMDSFWKQDGEICSYTVTANRFLRGMIRGLVGTMLQFGSGKITYSEFNDLFRVGYLGAPADFSPPGYGLYLKKLTYPENIFIAKNESDKGS